MVPLLISKAFNNTKTKITECARDIVVKYMETDGIAVAYEPLLAAAKDLKKKKAAITACECLREALKRFKKQVKSDDIVTFLPTVLNHTDGQISAAGVDLFLALRGVYKAQVRREFCRSFVCCVDDSPPQFCLVARPKQCWNQLKVGNVRFFHRLSLQSPQNLKRRG
jgi:hypothetical protein